METKFTPGPWYIDGIGRVWTSTPERQVAIAQVRHNARPNAALIKAAPDLYEALELADATLRGANMNRNVVERKVVAALKKARGE